MHACPCCKNSSECLYLSLPSGKILGEIRLMKELAAALVRPLLASVILGFAITIHAQIVASSCSASDVQAALNAVVADGTTVVIPTCPSDVAWTTTDGSAIAQKGN